MGRGRGSFAVKSLGAWLYAHMGLGLLAAYLVVRGIGKSRDTLNMCASQALGHKHPHSQSGVCTSLGGLIKGVSLLPFSSSLTVYLNVDHLLLLGPCKGPHLPALARPCGSSI